MNNFSLLKNKKILVTGGAGFIGSNLCEKLISLDAQITCLDNFSTGYKHNLEAISPYPYFSRDIAEFWRRWHISLSTWFRDYLYIPFFSTRIGLPSIIMRDGENGLLINRNIDEMAKAISYLYDNPDILKKYAYHII